jgi:hypothetical protein
MCNLVTIAKTACTKGRAGIATIWASPCDNVDSLTFDADGSVTAVTMTDTNVFVRIDFEKDTAFFNQEKTRPNARRNINVAQTISFNEDLMNPTTRAGLLALNECCCMHVIVKDNTGRFHYAGITHFPDEVDSPASDTYTDEDLRTGDGSGNTGADSAADINEYIETLTANVGFYAPFYVGSEASIPV